MQVSMDSVSSLPLDHVVGTPITNLRMKKEHLATMLKPLVLGFFARGGQQLQFNCVDTATLEDARKNPDAGVGRQFLWHGGHFRRMRGSTS